jgi:hypothetical protein
MGDMAQADRSTSGAIAPLPAGGPLVQNGPPFAQSEPPAGEAPAPADSSLPPPLQKSTLEAAEAATAPPESDLLSPEVAPAPARFETPPPSQVDADVPPRPVPDLDPMPVTAADFEDEAAPGLLATLGSTRPTTAWLSLGLGALALAFVAGLFIGRGTVSRPTPAPRVAASEPARAPATLAPAPVAAPVVAPTPSAAPSASVAAPAGADPAAPSDEAKGATGPKSLAPFNSKLANNSIASTALRIKNCKDVSVPPGSVSVVVTFATTGRVVAAAVTTPSYSLGEIGACLVAKLKKAQVPPFSGAPETVKKTIHIR